MLVTTYAGTFGSHASGPHAAFGADIPDLDPRTLSIGTQLADAESSLKLAFNALQIASVTAPTAPIRTELITAYQTARAGFVASARPWIEGYDKTPINERNPDDPRAVPTLPPEVKLAVGSGFAGFGAALPKTVLPSQILTTYGPVGREKTAGLAESLYDPYFDATYSGPSGFGAPVLLILLGIALTGGIVIAVTALLTKDSEAAKVAQADAARQKSLSQATFNAMKTLQELVAQCQAGSTDPAVRQGCLEAANGAAVGVLTAVPKAEPSKPQGGFSLFQVAGFIAIAGLLGTGGYLLYRRIKQGSAGSRYPRMAPSAAADDEGNEFGWSW
jgi:hypothetical protein